MTPWKPPTLILQCGKTQRKWSSEKLHISSHHGVVMSGQTSWRQPFTRKKYRSSTRLTTYIWSLRDQNVPYTITMDTMGRASSYNPASNKCRLCLLEIFFILFHPEKAELNQRSELFFKCLHKKTKKAKIESFTSSFFPSFPYFEQFMFHYLYVIIGPTNVIIIILWWVTESSRTLSFHKNYIWDIEEVNCTL